MDQMKFSSMVIIKIFHEIKWVYIVIMLVAATLSAASDTTSEPPPPRRTGQKINLPMSIVLACLISAFLLVCVFFFYFRRCANRQLALASTIGNHSERRSVKLAAACGLNPAVIATFTSFTYSSMIGEHSPECSVCLIEFRDHESMRLLPECNHVFHRACIDAWLALHVTCPVCRVSLVPKPNKLSPDTESSRGPNEPTKDHVSVEVLDLEHGITPVGNLSSCYSAGHVMVEPCVDNIERYPLRLPDEVHNVFKSPVTNLSTSHNVSNTKESSLQKSLKSASTNFVRGSDYFNYERFGQERQPGERNLSRTRSFNSHSGSDYAEEDSVRKSQRLMMFIKSPLNHLFQMPNRNSEIERLPIN